MFKYIFILNKEYDWAQCQILYFFIYFPKIMGKLGLVNSSATGQVKVKILFESISWNLDEGLVKHGCI